MRFSHWIVYGALGLVLSGCATLTRDTTVVRIHNVSREQIAKSLWEAGGKISISVYEGLPKRQVWPSVEQINKQKVVVKYDITQSDGFFYWSIDARDTIRILDEGPNSIIVSLRCEETQHTNYLGFSVLEILLDKLFSPLPRYHRRLEKERKILLEAVQRLQENEDVSIEWLGKLSPPQIRQ